MKAETTLSLMFAAFVVLLVAIAVCVSGCKTLDDIIGNWTNNPPAVVTNVIPIPVPGPTPQQDTLLPKPSSICMPDAGPECPNPFGLDIRCCAWNTSKGDWTFAACDEWIKSMTRDGKTITAKPYFIRNGIKYVTAGWKAPKSSGPLQPNLTATYQTTTRWYYWPTREGVGDGSRMLGAVKRVFTPAQVYVTEKESDAREAAQKGARQ